MDGKHYHAIAIDGPSGAGKSTLAKSIAAELNFTYVDTGAIYRTIGYAVYQRGLDPKQETDVAPILPQIRVTMGYAADGLQHMYLDGQDVTQEIRLPEMSMYASDVSALPSVRAFLLETQREMARRGNVIMDGRDIGTVVLPDADVKIFLTATEEERARRRYRELEERGTPEPYEQVLRVLHERDENDKNRAIAPLRKAEDAQEIDTTLLDFAESKEALLRYIRERIAV